MPATHFKLTALLVLGPLVSLLALVLGLWAWTGSNTSLASTLAVLARALPADQTLEAHDVSGSVRTGGTIGSLRWQQGALGIEARDVQLDWSLQALLHQELHFNKLRIGQLHIDDKRPPTPDAPTTQPTDFSLPVKVDAAISIDKLTWAGASTQEFEKLVFNYVFNSEIHSIYKGYIHISSGVYEFSGNLQAQAPMALDIRAKGVVQTPVPQSPQYLNANAQARLSGSLNGPQARLALRATLTPDSPGRAGAKTIMQADLSAELAPWQTQKIVRANGHWQALDLAVLWPQAPQTMLSGNASVSPKGQEWQGHVELRNTASGPWNLERLPLDTLTADLGFVNGQWALQTLQATVAGGFVQASGQLDTGLWQGQAKLQDIRPADIDSRVTGAPINGTIVAQQTARGLEFDASLQASAEKPPNTKPTPDLSPLPSLRLKNFSGKGVWAEPLLTLQAFRLEAQDAYAQGQLTYNTLNQATQGQLTLAIPGLQTTLNGHIANADGKGELTIALTDAAQAARWLARWPSFNTVLHGASVRGAADFKAQWAGGWHNEGRDLRLHASLRVPWLDWAPSTPAQADARPDWRMRDLQAELAGTPSALSLTTRGLAEAGAQKLGWQAQAQGGRVNADSWQASIHQFNLTLANGMQSRPWSLEWGTGSASIAAAKPVTLGWLHNDLQTKLTWSGGTVQLQGPQAGAASVMWQPGQWSQQSTNRAAHWQTEGRISNLPLGWIDAVSAKTMAKLGISSDMLLSGDWDAAKTDTLRLRATLERSAGDIRLHADDIRQKPLPAGMQDAWMQVNLNGNQLSSSLRWDSELAGKALVAFSTQLQPEANGWGWASDAPLGGSIQMKLPPMAAWSVLAPPGWRLRGTMDANVFLTGTLALPQWSGELRARNLAVRSVVDGIDFSQGSLNAHLHGQQLDIENFTLQGAGGTPGAGGQLAMSGSVFWLPGNTTKMFASRLSMALEAQVKALRLSSRPDRRVVVSGKLAAQLNDARLSLRGALAADQALITLPEDTAPELGDDVVVRRPAGTNTTPSRANVQSPTSDRATSNFSGQVVPDVQIELDLGPDFQLRGRGLETRLAGKATLLANGHAPPSLNGTVRTVRGTYLAYGQRLEIEQGLLRFTGSADNPSLAILAIRPKLTQRVGVQISGTALSPIVRLYAEPDLPDAEKLAWLVLGRSASGGGAETALMQQAALALLGSNGKNLSGSLTQALGLDELSFRGNSSVGESTASGASITLGKRLSNDFYLAYESSLNGAMGVFYIFYDLSRRLTLRAQAGEQSAIDLVFTLRYD